MLEEVVCFNAILVIIYWCVFFFFSRKIYGFRYNSFCTECLHNLNNSNIMLKNNNNLTNFGRHISPEYSANPIFPNIITTTSILISKASNKTLEPMVYAEKL